MASVAGKVVLVSGASSGIGKGLAKGFAKAGAKLAITGRNLERLQETARECAVEFGVAEKDIFIVTGDVTIEEEVKKIVESTVKNCGKLDVLCNVAGATRARTLDACSAEDLDFCFNVLVKSVFMMTKAAVPHLEKTKGNIVNMSSLSGLRPLAFAVPYSMCKCMVDRFTEICSLSLAPKGIRVNAINPATVMTDMFLKKGGPAGDMKKAQAYLDWSSAAIPLGRCGEIEECANIALFLASDSASYLSGIQFSMDGGLSLTSAAPKQKKPE